MSLEIIRDRLDEHRGRFIKGQWPTIIEQFRLSTHLYPDESAFVQFSPEEVSMTYKEATLRTRRIANWLISKGLQKGERVILTGPNTIYWTLGFLGILEAGGVVVPLDPRLNDKDTKHFIKTTGAKFLFAESIKYKSLDSDSGISFKVSLSEDYGDYILDLTADKNVEHVPADENDLAVIQFTSGTTGTSKGVMLTHKNLMSDVYLGSEKGYIPLLHDDILYALLPLNHSLGLSILISGLVCGCPVVFALEISIAQMLRDLEMGRITTLVSVPLLFNRMIRGLMQEIRDKGFLPYFIVHVLMLIGDVSEAIFKRRMGKTLIRRLILEKAQLHRIHYMLSGGSPLSPQVLRLYRRMGMTLVQGYGLTETATGVTLNPVDSKKLASVGKALNSVEVTILNPDAKGMGEVGIKGPICCQGYWGNPEATKALFNDDGWLLTGDIGYLDKDNYLFLTGRIKNIIATESGTNIYPEEIEDRFQLNEQINQIMIHGFLDDSVTRREAVEAIVYPDKDYYSKKNITSPEKIEKDIVSLLKQTNRSLRDLERVSRARIIDEPLPITISRKIKRAEVESNLENIVGHIIDI